MLGAAGDRAARPRGGLAEADGDLRCRSPRRRRCRRRANRPGRRAATRVPLPWRLRASPASRSRSYAATMVVRLRASSLASSRSAGRRVPGGSRPTSMARASASASCSLSGSAPVAQGPMSSTSTSSRDHRLPFQSTCGRLAIGLSVMRANMAHNSSPMSRTDFGPDGRKVGPRKGRDRVTWIRSWPS